ncbi:MAG: AMP-binding protein [bacterium]
MERTTANQTAVGAAIDQTLSPNLAEAFLATVNEVGDAVAIRTGDDSVSWSWSDIAEKASASAGALAALGVERGETVALMLDNRPEFIPLDLGAVMLGAVPFSIYQTLAAEEIEYLLRDAGAKVVFVEEAYSEQMKQALAGVDCVEKVVVLADDAPDDWMTLDEFEALDPTYDPADAIAEIDDDSLQFLEPQHLAKPGEHLLVGPCHRSG